MTFNARILLNTSLPCVDEIQNFLMLQQVVVNWIYRVQKNVKLLCEDIEMFALQTEKTIRAPKESK